MEDNKLIENIQNNIDTQECLNELIERHSGIFINIVNSYVPNNSIYSDKNEIIGDKNYHIYKSALSFNPNKNVKFSTYLGNQAKFLCLNEYNRKKRSPEVKCDEVCLDWLNYLSEDEHSDSSKSSEESEVLKIVQELISINPDTRVQKIFHKRYFSKNKNKVVPWRKISSEIGLSIQGCINIHNKAIQEIRKTINYDQ
ncbi:MAG: hypothetical protein CMM25_01620 [Rhodospirillaceae bacterium]|nr:hypothetical protein [Rhodospirillaceae bacterium]|tara:strand:- start:260 stop:853 length:594 start_codon:yes stop_codon:yes gene_type:complete